MSNYFGLLLHLYQISIALNTALKTVCPRFLDVFAFEADDWAAGRLTVYVYQQNTQLTILPCKYQLCSHLARGLAPATARP